MKNNKKVLYLFFINSLFIFSIPVFCGDYFFYVQLTDKNNSPYSLLNPSEFLSERAIERRQYFHLSCDSTDLPVNPDYLEQLKQFDIRIHNTTKWLNGVTIVTSDSNKINEINVLPFVKWTEYTGKMNGGKNAGSKKKSKLDDPDDGDAYGYAGAQIDQIKGKFLHDAGYKGNNIYIGILDAGFNNVDITPAFNLLRLQNRLLGTKDIIDSNSDVFREDNHGAYVLSAMAAEIPDSYIGTSPHASYWLVRTEYVPSEYKMETDFWVSGIEFLDSLGIDVVNSSLGYTVFDDSGMNFTYEDMDGKTTRISRAAELASQKGIVVVNSAGNDGNKTWKYIGAPADADGIITVGAVTTNGSPSNFSSFGPSSDHRVKPEISARGTSTALINNNGSFTSNGTSYSSPIIAGMMACMLQAAKENYSYISLNEIFDIVFRSAADYNNPAVQTGYGIPDFERAGRELINNTTTIASYQSQVNVYIDTMAKTLKVSLRNKKYNHILLQIHSVDGKALFSQLIYENEIINTQTFPSGMYALYLLYPDGNAETQKIIIR